MRTHIAGTTGISQVSSENHRIVSRDEWVAERKTLLAHEKELTRLRDRIARECRALPWVRINKNYVFQAPEGRRTLAQLFEGRRQLLVQHFMFAPGWEQGCLVGACEKRRRGRPRLYENSEIEKTRRMIFL